MNQQQLLKPIPLDKMSMFSKDELITLLRGEQDLRRQLEIDNDRLRNLNEELKQKRLGIEDQYVVLKNKLFGKSSEKQPSLEDKKKNLKKQLKKKKKVQLPSQRYPNAPLIERHVGLEALPECKCCGSQMRASGMTENSEFLTVVPAQYIVVRQKREKYRCEKCHGDIQTAPAPLKIKPSSGYSDEMVIDIAMSKYCDLIPIERYSSIAGRSGLMDLPPQSLIEQTHYLSDFVKGAYDLLGSEAKLEKVLHADETPSRMLNKENAGKSWYLWGFSGKKTCYFEIHDTRSGDVASSILKDSRCEFLVSDVFSGYAKAVRVSNEYRKENDLPLIKNIYCNAHARRKFKDSESKFSEESQDYLNIYGKIYRLNEMSKRWPHKTTRLRGYMKIYFEKMKVQMMEDIGGYSTKSSLGKAMSYYLKNYNSLTLFLENPELPIDNNSQERLLRNPVIGRKTWYGNHSERGARTTAILFSLVESCKLNNVNPRKYFKKLVEDLHQGKPPYTPATYASNVG